MNRKKDWVKWFVGAVASALSITAFVYFYRKGVTLSYADATSHMTISRRVIDSPTTGIGQFGAVWLPLPHFLVLPLIGFDRLYYTGLAGSILSMVSYVIASVFIYKITTGLTDNRGAGVVAALIFMVNPNVLYMQSTPMTETLLFACMAGALYCIQQWIQTQRNFYLVGGAFAAMLATLTRYEGWVFLVGLTVVVGVATWRKHRSWPAIEGTLVTFLVLSGLGIVAWMFFNFQSNGNPFYFQIGEYSKPSLWNHIEPNIGSWSISFRTYWYAMTGNIQWVMAVAGLGLVALLVKERFSSKSLPVLSLLIFVPFFVGALYTGERPLHVNQVQGNLYNMRFGLIMAIPAAIYAGYLVSIVKRWSLVPLVPLALALAIGPSIYSFQNQDSIVTLREPVLARQTPQYSDSVAVSHYLDQNYTGGKILMENFGNELVLFSTKRIHLVNNVYEGSYQQWEPAIADPAGSHIQVVIMRQLPGEEDKVFQKLYGTKVLDDSYQQAFKNDRLIVYTRKEA